MLFPPSTGAGGLVIISRSGVQFSIDKLLCEAGLIAMSHPLRENHDEYERLRKLYDENPEVKKAWPEHSKKIVPTPVDAGAVFRAAINLEVSGRRPSPEEAEQHVAQRMIRDRIDQPHVKVRIPIHHLGMQHDPSKKFGEPDSWERPSEERVRREKEYASRRTPFPPIYATTSEGATRRQQKRGSRPALNVVNGNHRVAAAIRRGDTHIDAHVPESDWERFKAHADDWAK